MHAVEPSPRSGMRARILAALLAAGGQPVSGAALAGTLGVTRTALWKHIEALRRDGWPIAGRTHRGYSLDPQAALRLAARRFVPELLEARRLGSRLGHTVHWLPEVGSTNDVARRLADDGAPEGTLVIADRQLAGRGRLRRAWWSPPGGLWMSLILRPTLPPERLPLLTLAAAAAVAEALERHAGRPVAVKWPNDVLIDDRKIAGILLETVAHPHGAEYVVAGIGINLDVEGEPVPPGLEGRLTWLAREVVEPVTRNEVAEAVLDRLEVRYRQLHDQGPDPVLDAWRARAAWLGEPVRVTLPAGEVVGIALDVAPDGSLVVEQAGGRRERVLAGDVQRLRPAGSSGPGPGGGAAAGSPGGGAP
ncbi:biotin/acetyl-CoA-carboxylase ligase [Thermaerobacter marianensis DSM 12885]|uniref:Bifunctional ligase/repressor BirA n=1 Tax=Thermaerobacter marianensis (strain ATCC 700841 / DSM 12885 / JCM 10246 / 7p75a) TaxID=644966 RepID=E6SLV3_THEM7|nr:biotin--[acetyl-CoA-carboxylase] ligase [Thermaerobacter marianensis]ADU51402.1 biotin/acetyl-CoA-carboxylase ligase [Thermaerobacter marianensis DSM 12885]